MWRRPETEEPEGRSTDITLTPTPLPSPHLAHGTFVGRSRSFAGLLHHTPKSNTAQQLGYGYRAGTWSSRTGDGVLGEGYASPGVPRKLMNSFGTLTHGSSTGLSGVGGPVLGSGGRGAGTTPTRPSLTLTKSGNGTLKSPRPNKARVAIEALTAGLQGCIRCAEEEMENLKSSITDLSIHSNQSQGKKYELEKYSKSSERYLKRVEYQLSRVEELGERYALQQKLREGVRAMAYAFSISEGREKESALANVKAGFRECTETLCALENQLQLLIGNFKMEMKGIQGFARLCPGDVFEITIKHGLQKWKTRGKVLKDGSQNWDFPRASFRGVLGEVMYIKAAEVKTLGKQVLLGNKFCEMTELLAPHPQLMTVNLNPSGSLKLSVVVRWSPVENEEGSLRSSSNSTVGSVSPSRKRRLSPIERTHSSSPSSSGSSTHAPFDLMNPTGARHSALWERSLDSIQAPFSLTPSKSPRLNEEETESSASGELNSDPSGNFSLAKKRDPMPRATSSEKMEIHGDSDSESGVSVRSLKDSVRKLSSLLEDIQGQYPELEALEIQLTHLESMIKSPCLGSSSSSLNIESALECFDFLDSVSEERGRESPESLGGGSGKSGIYNFVSSRHHYHNPADMMDPKMTARTTDSGISSLGQHSRTPSPSPSRVSNQPLITGNAQLDAALETHVFMALQLIHNLGSFGPLRRREREAVRKLQQQSHILGTIISRAEHHSNTGGFAELVGSLHLQTLWEAITGSRTLLCTSADLAVLGLEEEIRGVIREKFRTEYEADSGLPSRVSRLLVQQLLSTGRLSEVGFLPGDVLTVFQFQLFLKHEHSFNKLIQDLTEEEILRQELSNESKLISVVSNLSTESLPARNVLIAVIQLLLHPDSKVQTVVKQYFSSIAMVRSRRQQVVDVGLEYLESSSVVEREACCVVLGLLGARESTEELAFAAQTDKSPAVRRAAKEALILLGEEVHHHQLTLSTHGFQGLTVN